MKVLGIIAEFNPFHNGHKSLLAQSQALGYTHTVVVMSGHFVQRAQPAHTDKWTRSKAALLYGADVVIELPVVYATASAQEFARGAVSLLAATGLVDGLLFGSESGTIAPLLSLTELLKSDALTLLLKQNLNHGYTYATARQKAVETLAPTLAPHLAQPNNLLGLAYLQAAAKLQWTPTFHTYERQGVEHHATESKGQFASASTLRAYATHWPSIQPFVPPAALKLYQEAAIKGHYPVNTSAFEVALLSYLRRLTLEDITKLSDISEGIEPRLLTAFRKATSLQELYALIKTKRYPLSRVRRWVLSAFLGLQQEVLLKPPPYIRILGFTPKGKEVLSKLKGSTTLPFGLSLKRLRESSPICDQLGKLEALSTDLYSLMLANPLPSGLDYTHPCVILGEQNV